MEQCGKFADNIMFSGEKVHLFLKMPVRKGGRE